MLDRRLWAASAIGCLLIAAPLFARQRRPSLEAAEQSRNRDHPTLDEILAELNRPLPPIEDFDPRALAALERAPALYSAPTERSNGSGFLLVAFALLLAIAWRLRFEWSLLAAGVRERLILSRRVLNASLPPRRLAAADDGRVPALLTARSPATDSVEAAAPLTKEQIAHFKSLTEFAEWPSFLAAARCGNPIAREVLNGSANHAAVKFTLNSEVFKAHLSGCRNLVFSHSWVWLIIGVLQETETFAEELVVTSPLGQRHTIRLDASIGMMNTVLGYVTLPADVRRQLELRRWIIMQTKIDGIEQPQVLYGFRTAASSAAVARAASVAPGV
jgi:hypothetical protein